jgi:alpha-amylase/alpha-mannosidase (GH57 family)
MPDKEKIQQESVNKALRKVAKELLKHHEAAKQAKEIYLNIKYEAHRSANRYTYEISVIRYNGIRTATACLEEFIELEPDITEIINLCDNNPLI